VLNVVNYLGASSHFQNVAKGIIDSRDILYFLSLVFLGLYAAHLAMQEKK
jgi:ABC-2 type transport system permease protein